MNADNILFRNKNIELDNDIKSKIRDFDELKKYCDELKREIENLKNAKSKETIE